MSVYCGFATRQQESVYNTLIFKLISLLAEKSLKFIQLGMQPKKDIWAITNAKPYLSFSNFELILESPLSDDRSWAKKIVKLSRAMHYMERNKHHDPFFSLAFDELSETLKKIYQVSLPNPLKLIYNVIKWIYSLSLWVYKCA